MTASPPNNPSQQSIAEARQELLTGASRLADHARRLFRWQAVIRWLTVALAVLLVLVLLDAIVRREELGLRVVSLLTLVACVSYAAYRTLVPAWKFTPTPVQMARWVEQSRPELGEQLSTAVQLAEIPAADRRFGSEQFRESAIKDWVHLGFHPVWDSYLDTGRWWKSVLCLALLLLAIAACIWLWPNESWIGFTRLTTPWSAASWPRDDRLELRNPPLAVAIGSQVQVEIVDAKPPLPDNIDLLFRQAADGPNAVSVIPTTPVGEIAVANLPAVETAIEIRAVGGEDTTMPWHRIDVVQPPVMDSFRFIVELPQYAGGKISEIVGKRISALAGSRIQLKGHLNTPVNNLGLKLFAAAEKTESFASSESGWTVQLQQNRQDFSLEDADGGPWTARRSTSWQFQVDTNKDLQITLPDLWSVDVVQDAPPVVLVREPLMRDVSATAIIPVIGQATDDLGLASIVAHGQLGQSFRFKPSDAESSATAPQSNQDSIALIIWESNTASGDPSAVSRTAPLEKAIDITWELLAELQVQTGQSLASLEGQEVSVWIEATDTLGQVGSSQRQTFTIRPKSQLLASLEEKQRQLLGQLRELAESQRKNMQLAVRTAEIVSQSGRADQETVDSLSSVSQIEATISGRLSRGNTSLQSSIEDVIDLHEMNQLTESRSLLELRRWERQLTEISGTSVPAAVQSAYEAHQAIRDQLAESSPDRWSEIEGTQQKKLDDSSAAQALATEQLQSLLDLASRTEAAQQVLSELRSVLEDQRQQKLDTETFRLEDIASDNSDRGVTRRAGLSADQQSLARRLDRLVARIRELAEPGAKGETTSLAGAEDAADVLVERQASSLMRRVADQIQAQQLADATQLQEDVITVLEDALKQTSVSESQSGSSLAQRASQLRQSSEAMAKLAERQAALAEEIVEAENGQTASLSQEQSQVRSDTSRQAAELTQSGGDANIPAGLMEATAQQDAALTELAENNMSAAAQSAEEAARKLSQAAEELENRSEQLESAAKQEKAFQLAQSIENLVDQQESVVLELDQLAVQLTVIKTPELEDQMRMVASVQEEVRRGLVQLRDETRQLPAFDWALEQTAADMARSVAASQRFRIAPGALDAAQSALRRLKIVQQALESAPSEPNEMAGNEAPADGPESNRLVPPLASIRLLRGLQADVNEQTKALDMQSTPNPRRRQIAEDLSSQQRALVQRLELLMLELEETSHQAQQAPFTPNPTN